MRSLAFRCLLATCLAMPAIARAELRLCNDAPSKVETAIGYHTAAGWQSEGWWSIEPGACAVVAGNDLTSRYYYVHAHTVDGSATWQDNYVFCTASSAFSIPGSDQCTARGFEATRFFQIDSNGAKSQTQRLVCDQCKSTSGWRATLSLANLPGSISLDGTNFDVPTSGWVTVDYSGTTLYATVTANADVSSLQEGLPHIIRNHVDNNDDCNYILRMHTISLSPGGGGALQVYAAGHYEDWECPWTETPFGDISFGKHRLFEQNGDATVLLTPQTNGSSVWIDVHVASMQADGLLGNLLNSDWFGPWIRNTILQAVPQTVQLGNIQQMLPAPLKGFLFTCATSLFTIAATGAWRSAHPPS